MDGGSFARSFEVARSVSLSDGDRWKVIPVSFRRAMSLAATTSSSLIRSWPTSVTHPSTRTCPAVDSCTTRWRSSTSSTVSPAHGSPDTSQPQEPSVPPTPTASNPASTRSGCATVPASTVKVTPLHAASMSDSVADNSSSSPVCAACAGTAHSKIERPGSRSSGIIERISRSPVRCWWALIRPGMARWPGPPMVGASGCAACSSEAGPITVIRPSATAIAAFARGVEPGSIVRTVSARTSSSGGVAGDPLVGAAVISIW